MNHLLKIACTVLFFGIAQNLHAQQPTISSFSPTTAHPGDTITITGTNFINVQAVRFAGHGAMGVTVVNSTTILAAVGIRASGDVAVTTLAGTATLPGFVLTFPAVPTISSFSPMIASAGDVVTITGTNFSTVPEENLVRFGGVAAAVTSATATTLSVTVPIHAEFRPISVTVLPSRLSAVSSQSFSTTYAGGGYILQTAFAPKVDFASGAFVNDFDIVDLNGDGKKEIITVSPDESTISVLRNTSNPVAVSFAARVSFAAGAASDCIASGDMDGDGKTDFVTGNNHGQTTSVSVIRNTSNGSTINFAAPYNVPTGINEFSQPEDIAVSDLNEDGRPDIIIANKDGTVTIYRNESVVNRIILTARLNFTIPNGTEEMAVQDLDGDGKPELIIVASANNVITVLHNVSSGSTVSFVTALSIPYDTAPIDVATGDMDGDGKVDIIVNSLFPARATIYRNTSTTGNISMEPRVDFANITYPKAITVSDFDGDGKLDIITSNSEGISYYVSVFRNISTPGSFQMEPRFNYPVNSESYNVAVADMDNDGAPDILCVNQQSANISVLQNRLRGAHIFSISPSFGGPGTVVGIKGKNLGSVTGVNFSNTPATSFTVHGPDSVSAIVPLGPLNNLRVFAPLGNSITFPFRYYGVMTVTDFTPSSGPVGSSVIIKGANFSTTPANNIVYFGPVKAIVTGATSNELTVTVPSGAGFGPLTVTLNNRIIETDRPFVVTFPGAPASILANSFGAKQDIAAGAVTGGIAAGDIDGDGKADMIVTNRTTNVVSVFRNTSSQGAVSFAARLTFATGTSPRSVFARDVDADGKLDLIVSGNRICVLRNTSTPGNISFAARYNLPPPLGAQYIAVADIGMDGKVDVASLNTNSSFSISQNTSTPGNISFTAIPGGSTPGFSNGIAFGDLNADGKPEIIISTSGSDIVSVYTDIGGYTYAALGSYAAGDGPEDIEVVDLNGDKKPDLVMTNANGTMVATIKNTSTGTISLEPSVLQTDNAADLAVGAGDLDGDGKPDIITTHPNAAANLLSLMKNTSTGNITLAAPRDFQATNNPTDLLINDLDGDGKPEIIAASLSAAFVSLFRNQVNEPVVTPSGASPVSGTIVHDITIDPTVQTYNGHPYVQRHYDIEPLNNPATSTATITLYFSQQDFDNYNAHPAHGSDLPTNPTDEANKANLRIYQYHGISASGMPGTYSGNGVEINPDDANIVWNATAQWWEVTINVDGFSGFFAGSAGNSILPVNLLSFSANKNEEKVSLKWTTASEMNVDRFELQRSTDGNDFKLLASIKAAGNSTNRINYNHNDVLGNSPIYYYRLKMIDQDAQFTYSHVIRVKNNTDVNSLSVYPSPATSYIVVEHPAVNHTAQLKLIDAGGKIISLLNVDRNSLQTRVQLPALAKGSYRLIWSDGLRVLITSFVKQ